MSSRIAVREAVREDIPALLRLGQMMHRESSLAFLPFARHKVVALAEHMLGNPNSCCVFLAQADGSTIGFIAGHLTQYFFCEQYFAIDQGLFVVPAFRGTTAAFQLVRSFQDWARSKDAREVCISVSTGVNIQIAGRFLQKTGMKQVGGVFKLRLDVAETSGRSTGILQAAQQ